MWKVLLSIINKNFSSLDLFQFVFPQEHSACPKSQLFYLFVSLLSHPWDFFERGAWRAEHINTIHEVFISCRCQLYILWEEMHLSLGERLFNFKYESLTQLWRRIACKTRISAQHHMCFDLLFLILNLWISIQPGAVVNYLVLSILDHCGYRKTININSRFRNTQFTGRLIVNNLFSEYSWSQIYQPHHAMSVRVHDGRKNPHTPLSMFVVDIGIGATLFLDVWRFA